MSKYGNLTTNAVGRIVPQIINGKESTPYQGVGKFRPSGRKYAPPISSCADYPEDGNKVISSLREALIRCGLKDGMTISTHHHFRNGDLVGNQIFDAAAELGVKNLTWAPSASFECHSPLIRYLEDGTIHHIEGSLNGALGKFTSEGKMQGMEFCVLMEGATRPFRMVISTSILL